MDLPHTESPLDPEAQRKADLRRLRTALAASLAFGALLLVMFLAQGAFDWRPFAVAPGAARGLVGVLTAPLLHGSPAHLVANGASVLLLGTLAGGVYPRATLRSVPLLWIGSGLGAWLLGESGSHHLGASGLTHGLMFLVFSLGLLRRDRPAIAAGMIAFFLYGGMLLTVLPQEPGVSWQSHLGGAVAGVVSAFVFRRSDPQAPRRKYSWELEEEAEAEAAAAERAQFEPPRPDDVPVLWQRPGDRDQGVVLRFTRERRDDD
ncbi:rhomboid family intramembrane serine protease [Luteimonas vadosa]|uniref:Rhomboid family intramembrane serine protease n=1 Tax=Luteimonas vadosa TaxID=1165507 RepID=A0ABP9DUZ9_9GAMM